MCKTQMRYRLLSILLILTYHQAQPQILSNHDPVYAENHADSAEADRQLANPNKRTQNNDSQYERSIICLNLMITLKRLHQKILTLR